MPAIRLKTLIEFRINCLDFSLGPRFTEIWTYKKLCKPIQAFLKSIIGTIKVIIGIGEWCVSIVHTPVILHELRILILRGIFLSAHEKHMFEEVSSAVKRFWIEWASYHYIEGCCTFVRFFVFYQDAFHPVVQLKKLVNSLIARRFYYF